MFVPVPASLSLSPMARSHRRWAPALLPWALAILAAASCARDRVGRTALASRVGGEAVVPAPAGLALTTVGALALAGAAARHRRPRRDAPASRATRTSGT